MSGAPQGRVHIFWDVENKHPVGQDPRSVVHHLRSVASCYGQVAGVYAYAVRKAMNWVPEALFEIASETLSAESEKIRGGRAIGKAIDETNSTGLTQNSGQPHNAGQPQSTGQATTGEREPSITRGGRMNSDFQFSGDADGTTFRNTSKRTLGRVIQYSNAAGQVYVPPPGHQISLKYVLQREGVDARIVQNAAGDASLAMSGGMLGVLAQMRTPGSEESAMLAAGLQPIVMVVSDNPQLLRALKQLEAGGSCNVLLVGNFITPVQQAGNSNTSMKSTHLSRGMPAAVPLDWGTLKAGRYRTDLKQGACRRSQGRAVQDELEAGFSEMGVPTI
eukprot:gene17856-24240_t